MKFERMFLLCILVAICAGTLLSQSSPESRTITDPKSIDSESNAAARPVPIEDLYYTRDVFDPTWSPDGKQVAFVTDMSGRINLWKVSATGGWPIQLTQSDDRQFSTAWSPDGKWIVFQQDKGGTNCGTSTRCRATAAK